MPSGMNARPRSSTSISVPTFGEEGDRSAVACATRITALNISFISGPEQLPYSTNMRSACRDVRDRAYASHSPRSLQPLLREIRQSAVVNETRLRASPPPSPSFSLFSSSSFRFAFPPLTALLFLFSLFAHRFSAARSTFCVPTEMTARGEHPADRVSREINLSGISCNERTIFRLDFAILVSLVEDRDDASRRKSSVCVCRIW